MPCWLAIFVLLLFVLSAESKKPSYYNNVYYASSGRGDDDNYVYADDEDMSYAYPYADDEPAPNYDDPEEEYEETAPTKSPTASGEGGTGSKKYPPVKQPVLYNPPTDDTAPSKLPLINVITDDTRNQGEESRSGTSSKISRPLTDDQSYFGLDPLNTVIPFLLFFTLAILSCFVFHLRYRREAQNEQQLYSKVSSDPGSELELTNYDIDWAEVESDTELRLERKRQQDPDFIDYEKKLAKAKLALAVKYSSNFHATPAPVNTTIPTVPLLPRPSRSSAPPFTSSPSLPAVTPLSSRERGREP